MRIVEDSQTRLVLRDRTSWVSIVCGAAAVVISVFALSYPEPKGLISAALCLLFAIVFFRNSDVAFDKAARSCTVKRRDMWRLARSVIPFEAIKGIEVQTMIPGDSPTMTSCRLSLSTNNGEVPLSATYEPDLHRFEAMRRAIVDVVFTDRPAPCPSDPVRALVESGRIVEAIALLRQREPIGLREAKDRIQMIQSEIQTQQH